MSETSDPLSDLAATAASTIDGARFRSVLGHFCTGVTVVTSVDGDQPIGLTCQSFTSLSLDPPLVGFVPAKASTSWPRIRRIGLFCVNVLSEDQEETCRVFATPGADKFRGVGWRPSASGSPMLDDALAWIDCRVEAVHEAGDHSIVVGRVLDLEAAKAGKPLLFYRGGYGRFES